MRRGEAHHGRHIASLVQRAQAQAEEVEEYVAGRLRVEAGDVVAADAPEQKRAAHHRGAGLQRRFPIQAKYEEFIRSGAKDVEARVRVGMAANVSEGDTLVLGKTFVRVERVHQFADFLEMVEEFGVERTVPDADSIAAAVRGCLKSDLESSRRTGEFSLNMRFHSAYMHVRRLRSFQFRCLDRMQ